MAGDDGMCGKCKLRDPLCGCEFAGALFLLVMSLIWFALCLAGLDKIPKCRYGEPECFFVRQLTGYDSSGAQVQVNTILNQAVEGDSDSSYEKLAIPLLATLVSMIPPVLVFLATIFNQAIKTIEIGKFWLTGSVVTMLVSIYIVHDLTFDCYWWNDHASGNQEQCKDAMRSFVTGAFFICITQIVLLCLAVYHGEKERDAHWSEISEDAPLSGGVGMQERPHQTEITSTE